MSVKLISVNVGLPRDVTWRGMDVRTSIWKKAIAGRVRVSRLNLEGDEQSDLTVHGGSDKAVYVYPFEYYSDWRSQLPGIDLPFGAFGENFTTEGLADGEVHIGDRLRAGSATFIVTQPRVPCYKLGIRFDRPDMVKQFLHSKRNGFYLAVLHEGEVAAGDAMEWERREDGGVTITDIVSLYASETTDQKLLRRAIEAPALPSTWKDYFRKRLQREEI
jgi:MOSC domain-containing protein YiiM